MKLGFRTPSLKKSFSSRTTGRLTRELKKATNPLYGKKGMGWVNNPSKATYNKIYNKTTIGISSFSTKNRINIEGEENFDSKISLGKFGRKIISIFAYLMSIILILLSLIQITEARFVSSSILLILIYLCFRKNILLQNKYMRFFLYIIIVGIGILWAFTEASIGVFLLSLLISGIVYKEGKKNPEVILSLEKDIEEEENTESKFQSDYYTEYDLEEAANTGSLFRFYYKENEESAYEPKEVFVRKFYKRNGYIYVKGEDPGSGEIKAFREDRML